MDFSTVHKLSSRKNLGTQSRDSNPGPLGEKREQYFFATQPNVWGNVIKLLQKYLAPLVDDRDASASGQCRGLDDPLRPAAALLPDTSEQLRVGRKAEGPRQKAELLLAELQSQPVVVLPEPVLASDVERA